MKNLWGGMFLFVCRFAVLLSSEGFVSLLACVVDGLSKMLLVRFEIHEHFWFCIREVRKSVFLDAAHVIARLGCPRMHD